MTILANVFHRVPESANCRCLDSSVPMSGSIGITVPFGPIDYTCRQGFAMVLARPASRQGSGAEADAARRQGYVLLEDQGDRGIARGRGDGGEWVGQRAGEHAGLL